MRSEDQSSFADAFRQLTGRSPLSWQCRLYDDWVTTNHMKPIIDLPTGLGKTMVMAIWLIARSNHPDKFPTRLIYVVDRRTVVDQATDLARQLQDNFGRDRLAISTLRGQLADNREWSADPSRLAIIIGTVDLIGSGLLFSGYRSSFKRRPLEAGMLGQDSLLVLDEAHLSKPFDKLLSSIAAFQESDGKPMRAIRMSATTGDAEGRTPFTLEFNSEGNLTGKDAEDETIVARFGAKKRLTAHTLTEQQKLNDQLVNKAVELANGPELRGKRIVVFVRSPDAARQVAERIRKNKGFSQSVEILTGTMRGLERDELVEKPVFKERWLNGDLHPDDPTNQQPVFLVSTSAGEVGFDLNADHLVGDAAPLDSWIQRLGRVNRRGLGDAQIHLLVEMPKKAKDDKPRKLKGFDLAIANTLELLDGVTDVSPMNIAAMKSGQWRDTYADACSPAVQTVDLTDILLDAWSMTSITAPMPGRPDVAPWLRGIADWEPPQTEICWRAELDLDGFASLDFDDIAEWFDTHRILTHETLSVPTSVAAKWFVDRWSNLDDKQKSEVGGKPIIVDQSGLKLATVRDIVDQLVRRNVDAIRYAQLILPASFGGIERYVGLLDAAAPKKREDAANTDEQTRRANSEARRIAPDIADARGRYRERVAKPEDGEAESKPLVSSAIKPAKHVRFVLELESDADKTVRLVSYVPRFEKSETGEKPQTLEQHVGAVRKAVDDVLSRLPLCADFKLAARLAADWHDHGKSRERWQRLLVFPKGYVNPAEPMGKSGGDMKRDSRGYRHEFGSLREFTDAFKVGKLLSNAGKPISQEVFDLSMHLIATHHGRGRPHFPKGCFDPDCESRSDEIHTQSILRFARLQRKYGWWRLAWLENLLRCADALASADQAAENNPGGATGQEGGVK